MSKRFKFFIGHLSISLLIALLAIVLVFCVWYPSPLAAAVGVTHIFLMLIAVDVILGPLLGLLVYKEAKKSLKMDLSIIVLIQVVAFGFGFYSIAQGRPAWIVFNQNSFELIRVNDIYAEHPESISDEFKTNPLWGAEYVATQPNPDINLRGNDIFAEALGGISLAQRPERYVALNLQYEKIKNSSIPLIELSKYNDQPKLNNIITKYPQASAWLPLKASKRDMVVLINNDSGQVIKIVDLKPWE